MVDPVRVILLSLDGFPQTVVSPHRTRHLWELSEHGGRAPEGERCDLPSVTYVSHATLATGAHPTFHELITNKAVQPQPGVVPGWAGEARVSVPTLFDALQEAGLRSAAVCADQ
jgi:predicted AlkP superfamily pyrophosphatase or phosphodiesterase